MNKIRLGLIAAILAIAASTFTMVHYAEAKNFTSYYWFQYDNNGHIINQSVQPTLGSDPFLCGGTGALCAGGYTSFVKVGSVYEPAGTLGQVDRKD